jgi:hypothetical protein
LVYKKSKGFIARLFSSKSEEDKKKDSEFEKGLVEVVDKCILK